MQFSVFISTKYSFTLRVYLEKKKERNPLYSNDYITCVQFSLFSFTSQKLMQPLFPSSATQLSLFHLFCSFPLSLFMHIFFSSTKISKTNTSKLPWCLSILLHMVLRLFTLVNRGSVEHNLHSCRSSRKPVCTQSPLGE